MSGSFSAVPFNIGRSGQLVLVTAQAGPLTLNYTDFGSEQMTHNIESRPVNGETVPADIPDMWSGTIDIDRNSPDLDAFIALQEANYFAGQGLALHSLFQFVTEVNGQQTTWQYTNVTVTLNNAGKWRQNDRVQQSLKFRASRKKQVK